MKINSLRNPRIIPLLACIVLLSACSMNVKKDAKGKDKTVQIDTPIASLHVDKRLSANDTGLPVYPGSRRVADIFNDEDQGAIVNIFTSFLGLKVVAVKYQTDDPVEKVKDYYRSQLQQYGNLLECKADTVAINPGFGNDSHSNALTCEQKSGSNFELKAGTRNNQHVVAIEPLTKGCKYSLVYMQIQGKGSTI